MVLRQRRRVLRRTARGGNARHRARAAGPDDQRDRRLGQRLVNLLSEVKIAERDRRNFPDLRALRHDDLLESFRALNSQRIGRFHFRGRQDRF